MRKLAERARLDAAYDADKSIIRGLLGSANWTSADIEQWEKKADEEHWIRTRVLMDCPKGSVGVWLEEEVVDKRLVTVPVILLFLASNVAASGIILREENDFFTGSDDYYTQGLELLGVGHVVRRKDHLYLRSYGVRNLMYTPSDIRIAEDQPEERPWAGLTAALVEEWYYRKKQSLRVEWMAGVLGEWSQSDEIQTWFHDLIGDNLPMGWDNQIPNEPFVNVAVEYYRPLYVVGSQWQFDVTGQWGGSLGTAFVNMGGGLLLRGGWQVPSDYNLGLITPTVAKANELSAYLFLENKARFVAHNATLGGSLFQDGPSRELEPLVGDVRGGFSLGLNRVLGSSYDFRLVYSGVVRSKEFEGQKEVVDYGSILLYVMGGF